MITLKQAQDWEKKYTNVKIIDHAGTQFRVEIRDAEGTLIWREWNFEECHFLIKYANECGIERYQYAILMPHKVAGYQMYMVILTDKPDMRMYDISEGTKPFNGHLVQSIPEAFKMAAFYNVPLCQDGNELLEGSFK